MAAVVLGIISSVLFIAGGRWPRWRMRQIGGLLGGVTGILAVVIVAIWGYGFVSSFFPGNGQTETAKAQATATASPTASPSPTATASANTGNKIGGGKEPTFTGKLTASPVECKGTFIKDTSWLLCEPGVLLTNTATFTRAEVDATYQTNCPEGGFWYGSMQKGSILLPDSVGAVRLELKDYGPGTNHLIVIRCRLSDGKRDSDLNFTMKVGNFVVGHAIWSPIAPQHPDGSAYISMNWFGQQLVTSSTTGGTNCGSDGCSKVYVDVFDVNSQFRKEFLVTNITGKPSGNGIVSYEKGDWKIIQ